MPIAPRAGARSTRPLRPIPATRSGGIAPLLRRTVASSRTSALRQPGSDRGTQIARVRLPHLRARCGSVRPPRRNPSGRVILRDTVSGGGAASENALTLILSVLSITLTQMVLNGQRRSEQALHLKIDDMVYAIQGARNEVAGIETKSTGELDALRRTGEAAEDELKQRTFIVAPD
ncbi:low affinity iron permease family protein [Sphingomonas sp. NPDC079357]|uniref:low affinity iron permease family protein n=1 Tax=Sphingomonas sp. NPDC079357 TaxID=3364518 RepID=UPI00384B9AE6